jgi:hypothetical protein
MDAVIRGWDRIGNSVSAEEVGIEIVADALQGPVGSLEPRFAAAHPDPRATARPAPIPFPGSPGIRIGLGFYGGLLVKFIFVIVVFLYGFWGKLVGVSPQSLGFWG